MLATEMIAKLQEAIATDGDLPVIWDDRDYGMHELQELKIRVAARNGWQYVDTEGWSDSAGLTPAKVIEVQ